MQDLGPIPMEELVDSGAESRDGHGETTTIIESSLAIVSMVSSSTLLWMILRSRVRLSTTFHRLIVGMSISDILFSLSLATFNTMAPRDMDYFVWNARGNQATCSAQGFLSILGALSSLIYSCSLNLYYLAMVKFQKTDKCIRTKIEPYLHGVPIIYSTVCSITLLVKENINIGHGTGNCYVPVYEPPHCIGYENGEIRDGFEIPCGRGSDGVVIFSYIALFSTIFMCPIIIFVSLGVMYRAVLQQETRMTRYYVGQPAQTPETTKAGNADAPRSLWERLSSSRSKIKRASTTTNRSMSRPVMYRAIAYASAFFLAWSFIVIGLCYDIAEREWPTWLLYLSNIFNPLQGFFNVLIFLYPRVLHAKQKGNEDVTWCQAFAKAFWGQSNESKRVRPREAEDRDPEKGKAIEGQARQHNLQPTEQGTRKATADAGNISASLSTPTLPASSGVHLSEQYLFQKLNDAN